MQPVRTLLLVVTLLSLNTGCMTTRLVAKYDSDNIQVNKTTKVTLLWGILQAKDVPAACESKSICQVTTRTNIGQILISAVTLGIVVPQRLTWQCCPSVEPEVPLR